VSETKLVGDLRPTDWLIDGVGMNASGQLVIRHGPADGAALCRVANPETWLEAIARSYEVENKLSDMERQINARQPDRFLPKAIVELEKRGAEAEALRGEGAAGKIMCGQSQAYRDAAAFLRSLIH
jgi:hypothetical protein